MLFSCTVLTFITLHIKSNEERPYISSQVTPQENPGGESRGLEELQQENLLQTLASSPAPLQRWSKHSAVLSAPFPDDHPESFILDLKNLPELGHADTGSQNPNIQVSGGVRLWSHITLVKERG